MNGNTEQWLMSDLVPPDVLDDLNLTHSAAPPTRLHLDDPARIHIAPADGGEPCREVGTLSHVEFGFDGAADGGEVVVCSPEYSLNGVTISQLRQWSTVGIAPPRYRPDRGAERCPCGGESDDWYAPYCGYDCVPNWRGAHTTSDQDRTAMHWRPDLVTAIDDTHLKPWFRRRRVGDFYVEILERAGTGQMHVRLDDDHRWVGADLSLEPVGTFGNRYEAKLRALRRELDNDRHLAPAVGADPARARIHWGDRPAQQLHARMWARMDLVAADSAVTRREIAEQQEEVLRRVRARRNSGPESSAEAPRRIDPRRRRWHF